MAYQINHLTQVKNENVILHDVNLTIPTGQIMAILGPSGSGKTTLLRILAGMDLPASGEVDWDGGSQDHGILVFQDYQLFPFLTVYQNVAFGLKMQHFNKTEINQKVIKMLKLMEIETIASQYPKEISGGQQQRVALARALILAPKLLLLDEPFASLDESLRMEMLQLVKEMQRRLKITIVFVTHYKSEAYLLSQQVAVLIDGQIWQVDAPDRLDQQPHNLQVAQFLGNANFVTGSYMKRRFSSLIYEGPAKLMVTVENRMDQLLYLPFSGCLQTEPSSYPAFNGLVTERRWNGQNYLYEIQVNDQKIKVAFSKGYSVGTSMQLYFTKEPLVF